MKFTCNRQELSEAVSNVQRAISPKTNLPVLEGIMIKTQDNEITLCAYDLEIGIKTSIKANILEEGEIVVKAKLFADIVRCLPGDVVNFETDEQLIAYIKCSKVSYQLVGISAREFPELPSFNETDKLIMSSSVLKDMMKKTKFAIADNNQKAIYTGTLFEIKNNTFTMVSVDGYKMAIRREATDNPNENKFVVPGKTINEVLKLPCEDDEEIKISIGQRHIIFVINKYSIISRLLEGSFMDYNATIPSGASTSFEIDTDTLISSVERISLLNSDKLISPLCCDFKNNEIKLTCSTTIGKAEDYISVPIQGEEIRMGFNHRYLLETLKNIDSDKIKIEINGNIRPLKIVPIEGDSFLYIVLPMKI